MTNPLNYRSPEQRPRRNGTGGAGPRFFLGLTIGTAVSLIFWPVIWRLGATSDVSTIIGAFLLLKFGAALALFCFDDKRPLGAGFLVSFVTGFMVFFGTCSANFKI